MLGSTRKRKASSAKVEVLKEEKEKSEGAPDFECNICLELAIEPVVTCCGHLFCWPCLYQWLHVHCNYQECPVCKGKVNDSSIVPIYGRGSLEATVKMESEKDGNLGLKVPPRPQGNRVESLRQRLQSRPFSGPGTSLDRLLALFEDDHQGVQFVPAEGRNPWDLARHTSPNSQISASSSFHQDGAASQQRAAIVGSISRFSAILAEIRSLRLSRRSDEPVGIASADDQRDFEPVVSQTSNSSTMAMVLGNDAATDASVEPSRGGSSMLLRVRAGRRSTPVVSQSNTAADGASDGPNRRSTMVLRRRGRNSTSVVQGDTSAETNASSVEPSSGGFTMVLRRGRGRSRSRSSDSSSMDHVGQRRLD